MSENEARLHFRVVRFIYDAGLKLRMQSVPLATAATIYHKFFKENSLNDFDPYLIASASLYLAGKVEEEHVKLRDVINVTYRSLHRNQPPLEMGESFWKYRESLANCELYLLRALDFRVSYRHPHKYLLHYLKFVQDWFEPYKWEGLPIANMAWAVMRDVYHGDICLKYKPQHMAVAILYFAFQCHGVEVPYTRDVEIPWWKVLGEDITLDIIKDIIREIIYIYDMENTLNS